LPPAGLVAGRLAWFAGRLAWFAGRLRAAGSRVTP